MRFDFVKCHGSGNDFPMIDARGIALSDAAWTSVARGLADRAGPVGGDGLLLLTEYDSDAHHNYKDRFGFRMFNPDGSEAETCLNGLRCVARMGFERSGVKRATVHLKTSTAEVAMADDLVPEVYTIREIAGPAMLGDVEAVIAQLSDRVRFTAITMPNPHFVAFVERIDETELVRIGTICEAAPEWLPDRANVSFVEVRGADAVFVRTFERGVGLTDSCGSAMAASTYAACLTGRTEFAREVTVFNRGGLVRARAESDGMVTIEGNATYEWAGSAEVDLASGRVGELVVTRHFDDEIAAWARVVERTNP